MKEINDMFPNIAGYDKIKAEAAQLVDVLLNTEKYTERGAHCPRGWLFYGEPGMGKTQIVKDIGAYLDCPVIEISSSDAINRNYSMQEDILNGFAYAKKQSKAILFLDEIDKFAGYDRFEYNLTENINNSTMLLHELDGVKDIDGIFVIATANDLYLLSDSLLRSGRFDRKIKFCRPDSNDREEIIKLFMKNAVLGNDVSIRELVRMTYGKSCAEIECLVNEAIISAVASRSDTVNLQDFNRALNRIVFKDIPRDSDTKSQRQIKEVAYHEAGHALLGCLICPDRVQMVSILHRGSSAGSVRILGDEQMVLSHSQYLDSIKIGLAGMYSVYVMTGEMTAGNQSDIQSCVETARLMLDEGFYGVEYVTLLPPRGIEARSTEKYTDLRADKIAEILAEIRGEVENILRQNKHVIEAIANRLVEEKELSNKEVQSIIASNMAKAC